MSNDIATPHINPKGVDIAETILLPGDPLRAKFIAENFLDDAVQFNEVRNMLGFTGTYKGNPISVMGTGMGMPSIGIYSWELIHNYGVKNLIRVGSIGAMQEDIDLHDVIVASAASTDSRFLEQYNLPGTLAPTASWKLLKALVDESERQGAHIHVGNVLSSDIFYNFDETVNSRWAHMGVLGVEMESAALYATAAEAGVNALGLFTVSDNLVADTHLTAEERQTAFRKMIELTLPLAGLDK
ncbi:Purine nucleoside phosphorylase [Corynebacterium camporealensis]|uniref:Uridine phosphorylase n=1 Tax=Corynebacterium camporealensis TaxID=161896 RepID=A0A0F6QWV2_9CORY|nr:purine-nucleoside phosphorylase [Corynebacterium camporealensis]AKE39622.1 purine-nucleoside phosphorylase, DeoD family [Corynebacterium camporealensis]AVH88756.1 Purine nucleoside phosphorylase [Corynebacterium camporealensis]